MSPCDRSKGGDLLTNCRKRRLRRLVEAVLQRRRFPRNPHHLSQKLSSAKNLLHFAFGYFAPSALHIGFPGAAPTARSVSPPPCRFRLECPSIEPRGRFRVWRLLRNPKTTKPRLTKNASWTPREPGLNSVRSGTTPQMRL